MTDRSSNNRDAAWASRLERLPRVGRIGLSMLIAGLLALLAWLVIMLTFGSEIGNESVVRLGALVLIGLPVYAYGWSVLVGFDPASRENWRAQPASITFVWMGCVGALLALILLIIGVVYGEVL